MTLRTSNYPRQDQEEEDIENYLPWQWAVLFVAALSPSLLAIWIPSFRANTLLYIYFQRFCDFIPIVGLLILPFIFNGGSLARATWDRIKEQASVTNVIVGLSGPVVIAIPSLVAVATGRDWPT